MKKFLYGVLVVLLAVLGIKAGSQKCCSSVMIESSGKAALTQINSLGLYDVTNRTTNGMTSYKHREHNRYLYFNDEGNWFVGSTYYENLGFIQNAGDELCPYDVQNYWAVWGDSQWENDTSLKVTCISETVHKSEPFTVLELAPETLAEPEPDSESELTNILEQPRKVDGQMIVLLVDDEETVSKSETGVVLELEPETVTEPKSQPETVTESKSQPETVTEPKSQPETVTEPKSQPETVTEPKSQTETELKNFSEQPKKIDGRRGVLLLEKQGYKNETCQTESGDPCRSPFTYNGKDYNGCTMDGHDRLWCYTGTCTTSWGNCHSGCPAVSCIINSPRATCKTTLGRQCIFPFEYKGINYNGCTKHGHDQFWCYTVPGSWDNCDSDCPYETCGITLM